MKTISVTEFMSRDLSAAREDMLLPDLVKMLDERKVRGLPVVDDNGNVTGIVTETDIFLKEKGVPFSMEKVPSLLGQIIDPAEVDKVEGCRQVPVGDVMTRKVTTVTEDATLEEVTMVMYEKHVTLLPVLVDGKLSGVVRRVNILRRLYG
jgi:CBS domain-containing protein